MALSDPKPVAQVYHSLTIPLVDDDELRALAFVIAAMASPGLSNPGRERIARYVATRFGVTP